VGALNIKGGGITFFYFHFSKEQTYACRNSEKYRKRLFEKIDLLINLLRPDRELLRERQKKEKDKALPVPLQTTRITHSPKALLFIIYSGTKQTPKIAIKIVPAIEKATPSCIFAFASARILLVG
jgi:hypothetical protein